MSRLADNYISARARDDVRCTLRRRIIIISDPIGGRENVRRNETSSAALSGVQRAHVEDKFFLSRDTLDNRIRLYVCWGRCCARPTTDTYRTTLWQRDVRSFFSHEQIVFQRFVDPEENIPNSDLKMKPRRNMFDEGGCCIARAAETDILVRVLMRKRSAVRVCTAEWTRIRLDGPIIRY